MSYFIKIILLIIFFTNAFVFYSQTLDWVKPLGGTGWDSGNSINVDQQGNIYTTGHFQETADFDPSSLSYNFTANDLDGDNFISKLNANGNFIWAKKFGGNYFDGAISALDYAGNIYSTGYFCGTADFDPGINNTIYSFHGDSYFLYSDIFINKLDSDGNFEWAKHLGGYGSNIGNSIVTDNYGNVYIAGTLQNTFNFYSDSNISPLVSLGIYDAFICKYDTNGNFQWVKKIGGIGHDEILDLKLDEDNNLYFTGYFTDTVDFDASDETYNLTSATNAYDVFVCKYNSSGDFIWAKQFLGSENGYNIGNSISFDEFGNILVSGEFSSTVDFDPGPNNFSITHNQFYSGFFICKLNPNGDFVWAKYINVDLSSSDASIQTDSFNNIYILGSFYGAYDFDPSNTGIFALNSPHGYDIFLCKLDPNGNFIKAMKMGSTLDEKGKDITIDSIGNIYITGYFQDSADFDPSPTNTYILNPVNDGLDAFILKLNTNSLSLNDDYFNNFNIYPNPTSSFVEIRMEKDNHKELEIIVTDTSGKILDAFIYQDGDSLKISLQEFPIGIYYVTVKSNQILTDSFKIIKK